MTKKLYYNLRQSSSTPEVEAEYVKEVGDKDCGKLP